MAVFGSHLIIENLYLYFYHLHLFPLNAFEYKKKTTGKLKKNKTAGCFGSIHDYVTGPICIKHPSI